MQNGSHMLNIKGKIYRRVKIYAGHIILECVSKLTLLCHWQKLHQMVIAYKTIALFAHVEMCKRWHIQTNEMNIWCISEPLDTNETYFMSWNNLNKSMFGFYLIKLDMASVLEWDKNILGLYSLSGKTSYRQISWSLETARLDVIMIVSLWNLAGVSAALLPRCLPNFRAIGKV